MRKTRLISDQKAMQTQGSVWAKESAFLADQTRAGWKEARSEKFFQVEADTIWGGNVSIKEQGPTQYNQEKENTNGTSEDRAKV